MALVLPLNDTLHALFNEVFNDAKKLGLPLNKSNLSEIKIGYKEMKPWGVCRYTPRFNNFEIYISRKLISSNNIVAIKNTIMHEIIHTCKGALNHGANFKRYGKMCETFGYTITRLLSEEEVFGHKIENKSDSYKYVIKCPHCGKEYGYNRFTRAVAMSNKYICGKCHNLGLERIK
jgi:predicted SprT family Zn-dependent metalloprotease